MISIFTFISTLLIFAAMVIILFLSQKSAIKNLVKRHEEEVEKIHELYEKEKKMAITDELTGIYNRRGFMMRLKEELNRIIHYDAHRNLCLLYMDLEDFKTVNDVFGHNIGDILLKEFAKIMKDNARTSDIIARFGGDEFAIIIPEHTADFYITGVFNLIDRLREKMKIKAASMLLPSGLAGVSAGVEIINLQNFDPKKENLNKKIEEILNSADQKMYKNKRERKKILK